MCVTGGVSQDPRCYAAAYLSLSSGELTRTSSYMSGS